MSRSGANQAETSRPSMGGIRITRLIVNAIDF